MKGFIKKKKTNATSLTNAEPKFPFAGCEAWSHSVLFLYWDICIISVKASAYIDVEWVAYLFINHAIPSSKLRKLYSDKEMERK